MAAVGAQMNVRQNYKVNVPFPFFSHVKELFLKTNVLEPH